MFEGNTQWMDGAGPTAGAGGEPGHDQLWSLCIQVEDTDSPWLLDK